MKQPLVSIVTPVFNGERYIQRTIESVLCQKYTNIEYIVVDGGSSDRTLTILESHGSDISRLISEPDDGMYDALNKGFRIATGEIFCYLNADDYFYPDTVELVVERFNSTGAQLVFGNCILVDENERELSRYSGVNLPYDFIKLLGRIPFAQQAAFWTRQLYAEVGGFDEKYRYVGDTKFFFECLRIAGNDKAHLDSYLAMFRQHDQAFSHKVRGEMAVEHQLALSQLALKIGYTRHFVEFIVKSKNWRNFCRRLF